MHFWRNTARPKCARLSSAHVTQKLKTGEFMPISTLLLPEFDQEMKVTRTMLERVPLKADFVPHAKSMPLGKLAAHLAQLTGFGLIILTTPELDVGNPKVKIPPVPFESAEQLVKVLDDGAAQVRGALAQTPDSVWT